MQLHTYFRSSAAYRVRIALNLKGLAYAPAFVHLTKAGGEQKSPAYKALNPQALVPTLTHNGQTLTQSLAIIEYLDEVYPQVPLLPKTALARAEVRAFALAIACDIHPVNNLRILSYLKGPMGHDQATVDTWYRHWTEDGLQACEQLLPAQSRGAYCFGDTPSLADICLVPQMFNARRFNCQTATIPKLVAIDAACQTVPAFASAAPGVQPDAE
jgi:maleylacetoacetate isomerase